MIEESRCNRVYFSALLPEACPVTYRGLVEVLDRYGVPFSLLQGTRDIWCRDYMPLQRVGPEFVSFDYHPDYLMDTPRHRRTISDGIEVARANGIRTVLDRHDIKVDGGNAVHSCTKVILTSKVFEENPGVPYEYLCNNLRMSLGAEPVFIPWDSNEIYGHTDGVVRFIDDDTLLMTNYSQWDSRMADRFRRCLEPHFENIYELYFDVEKPYRNNWAYINWLQTDKVLILPKFNVPEDRQAYEQISCLMPMYSGRIEMVDATDLIRHGGCLNCASWTVYETRERMRDDIAHRPMKRDGEAVHVVSSTIPETYSPLDDSAEEHLCHLTSELLHEGSFDVAERYYRLAMSEGFQKTANQYAAALDMGWIGRVDRKEALSIYRRLAYRGDPVAMFNYGMMILTGHGTRADASRAVKWIDRAAEAGVPAAMTSRAIRLAYGSGDSPDYGTAYELLCLAAQEGDAAAFYQLGCFYMQGLHVEKDCEKAAEYFRMAADLGDGCHSEYALARCHYYGEGVPRDERKAHELLSLAIGHGLPEDLVPDWRPEAR